MTRQSTAYLEIENARLQSENTQLRKRLAESNRHAQRVERAYEDALQLAMWHAVGIVPSRRYAATHGIGQRAWQNAIALLKLARVVVRHRHWAATDAASIESRLAKAKGAALEDPDRYRLRLNRHGRR